MNDSSTWLARCSRSSSGVQTNQTNQCKLDFALRKETGNRKLQIGAISISVISSTYLYMDNLQIVCKTHSFFKKFSYIFSTQIFYLYIDIFGF